jgi:TrmH family RNA methyltransferase
MGTIIKIKYLLFVVIKCPIMLSKANIKYIKSLQVKKYRKQEQCFIVEGAKSVNELLFSDFEVVQLISTPDFLRGVNLRSGTETIEVSEHELSGIGEFQTNNTVLAIARMKPNLHLTVSDNEFALVLDDIRDPGNLGTILRTADWFGIQKVIASPETSDFYNPKVISASMGSFTRVSIFYTSLPEFLINRKNVFGAYLDGKDIHQMKFGSGGLVVVGNESQGISSELEKFITNKVTIPKYGKAESLNAAIAAAIICDSIRRG